MSATRSAFDWASSVSVVRRQTLNLRPRPRACVAPVGRRTLNSTRRWNQSNSGFESTGEAVTGSGSGGSTATKGNRLWLRLPQFLQGWVWFEVLPKAVRRRFFPQLAEAATEAAVSTPAKPASWFRKFWENPASPLIILPLLVGSQAIQLISLRSELSDFTRRADTRLTALREVLRRINSGEWVVSSPDGRVERADGVAEGEGILNRADAEREIRRVLGTGQEDDELEWMGSKCYRCPLIFHSECWHTNASIVVINEAKEATFPPGKGAPSRPDPKPESTDGPDQPVKPASAGKVAFY